MTYEIENSFDEKKINVTSEDLRLVLSTWKIDSKSSIKE